METGDGVTVECESLTLSRDIPTGLGWIAGIVEGVARESVEQTLGSIRRGGESVTRDGESGRSCDVALLRRGKAPAPSCLSPQPT